MHFEREQSIQDQLQDCLVCGCYVLQYAYNAISILTVALYVKSVEDLTTWWLIGNDTKKYFTERSIYLM